MVGAVRPFLTPVKSITAFGFGVRASPPNRSALMRLPSSGDGAITVTARRPSPVSAVFTATFGRGEQLMATWKVTAWFWTLAGSAFQWALASSFQSEIWLNDQAPPVARG